MSDDINARDEIGYTRLQNASYEGNIKNGADVKIIIQLYFWYLMLEVLVVSLKFT